MTNLVGYRAIMAVVLQDCDAQSLKDDSLTLPPVERMQVCSGPIQEQVVLRGGDDGTYVEIFGHLTSLTEVAFIPPGRVPEPSTLALLSLTFLMRIRLGSLRRRQ